MDNLDKQMERINKAVDSNKPEEVASGLNEILKDYNESVMFNNMNEFDEFFNDKDSVLKL